MSGLGIPNLFRGSERSIEQIVKLQLKVIDAIVQEVRGENSQADGGTPGQRCSTMRPSCHAGGIPRSSLGPSSGIT